MTHSRILPIIHQLRQLSLNLHKLMDDFGTEDPRFQSVMQILQTQQVAPVIHAIAELQRRARSMPIRDLKDETHGNLDFSLRNQRNVRAVVSTLPDDVATGPHEALIDALDGFKVFTEESLQAIEEVTTAEGGYASLAGIRDSVDKITTYPVQTQQIAQAGALPYPTAAPAGVAPLGVTIENAFRDVLGWRPKPSDDKGFVAALTRSFPCKEVEGRRTCVYTPRTYAVQVQADMGAVTGAQASIFGRAQSALDQSLILLDRIKPLRADADDEDTSAVRAIVESELTELVNELGLEGGPRVQRVDSLFVLLRGKTSSFDPEDVAGQLGIMREKFGLRREKVNTIEEEQILSDYITLVDYVNSLYQSWDNQRQYFDRSGTATPYLGTQLVLVSRALAVVAESVYEVGATMDSVFLGPAERQTIELTFDDSRMFVAELLAWVDQVASEEGPRLILDGGKAGVFALHPTLDNLTELVTKSMIPPQDPARLPAGYATPRVQRALGELAGQLEKAADLVEQIVDPVGYRLTVHRLTRRP